MLIVVVQIVEVCSEPCQTSNMNLFPKSLMAAKVNSKCCQTSEMELSSKLLPAAETNSECC